MQVTTHSVKADGYTTHTLEVVLGRWRCAAQHMISDASYAALDVKDKNDLIESQLWQQLMHRIEHQLRKTRIHDYSLA